VLIRSPSLALKALVYVQVYKKRSVPKIAPNFNFNMGALPKAYRAGFKVKKEGSAQI
jgi:hypothetical protein